MAHWEDGNINSLIHFAGSTNGEYEAWLCRLFEHAIGPDDWVLCSHRAHFHYHLYMEAQLRRSGSPIPYEESAALLVNQVLAGRSMFLYSERFIQSAIVGGLCGVAAGLAMSIKARGGSNHVWLFCGDGCEDQGSLYEAVRMVYGRNLPCTFLIEDNNRQCGVSKQDRKVNSFPWPSCVVRHEYEPKYSHAGNDTRPPLKSQDPPNWLRH